MCDCIEKIEKMLTDKMTESNPGCEIVEEVEFQNKAWVFGDSTKFVLNNPMLGKYGKRRRFYKFSANIHSSYCPFCGESLKPEPNKQSNNNL
jgi:hypothetical protein